MVEAKHKLRYLTGTTNLASTCKQEGFTLAAFSDVNWVNNPDKGRSTSSYLAFLSNGPISFKVETAGADCTIDHGCKGRERRIDKEGSGVSLNVMKELGFGTIDNTASLRVAGNQTHNPQVKHVCFAVPLHSETNNSQGNKNRYPLLCQD